MTTPATNKETTPSTPPAENAPLPVSPASSILDDLGLPDDAPPAGVPEPEDAIAEAYKAKKAARKKAEEPVAPTKVEAEKVAAKAEDGDAAAVSKVKEIMSLDPDDPAQDYTDQEKSIIKAAKQAVGELSSRIEAIEDGLGEVAGAERQRIAARIVDSVDKAITKIEQLHGIKADPEDIREALMQYGRPLMEKMGDMSEDLVVKAWQMDNVDILFGGKKTASAPELLEASARGGLEKKPKTIEEMIKADLKISK